MGTNNRTKAAGRKVSSLHQSHVNGAKSSADWRTKWRQKLPDEARHSNIEFKTFTAVVPTFGPPAWTYYTADAGVAPVELAEKASSARTARYYRPGLHVKRSITLGGGPVSIPFTIVNTSGDMHYIDDLSSDRTKMFIIPTRRIYNDALGIFPELAFRPSDGESWWQHRGDNVLNYFKEIHPGLNTGFSLINFLLQWKDVKSLFDHWLSTKGRNKHFADVMRDLKSPKTAVKRAANEWLDFEYGSFQFIRDAYKIFKIFQTWKANADKFLANAGTLHGKTQRDPLARDVSTTRSSAFYYRPFGDGGPGVPDTLQLNRVLTISGSATLVYSYTCPEMRGFIARLAQLCTSYGVSLDPSIVWDAIPFSFVVDWFVNIGEWLHSKRKDLYEAEVTYWEAGRNSKISVYRELVWNHTDMSGVYRSDVVVVDHYTRRERSLIAVPDVALGGPENVDRWTIERLTNATALTAQQILNKLRNPKDKEQRKMENKAKAEFTQIAVIPASKASGKLRYLQKRARQQGTSAPAVKLRNHRVH